VLPLALGIGEAKVDPVDLLILDLRKDLARAARRRAALLAHRVLVLCPVQYFAAHRGSNLLKCESPRASGLGPSIPARAKRVRRAVNFSRESGDLSDG
jgi:hypothetical protein